VGSVKRIFSTKVRIGRLRSSKVIDFGTNQKHICDFLLVRHSKLGSILHRFRDTEGFLHPPYSTLILGMFPLDQIADLGVTPSMYNKLCRRENIFEIFQPM